MEKFISRIIDYRKSKGITQKEMADKLGIGQVAYSQIETGKTELTLNRLSRIANILEINLVTLLLPDYNQASFTQNLVNENSRLKKNNDLLIDAFEDKNRFIELLAQFYPETESFIRAGKTVKTLKDLGLIKPEQE